MVMAITGIAIAAGTATGAGTTIAAGIIIRPAGTITTIVTATGAERTAPKSIETGVFKDARFVFRQPC